MGEGMEVAPGYWCTRFKLTAIIIWAIRNAFASCRFTEKRHLDTSEDSSAETAISESSLRLESKQYHESLPLFRACRSNWDNLFEACASKK